MEEIEEHGGMLKAIEVGLPKLRIEEAAASKQARIDRGADKIIGVNIFQVDEEEGDLDLLNVDEGAVRESQIEVLSQLKNNRDEEKVQFSLLRSPRWCWLAPSLDLDARASLPLLIRRRVRRSLRSRNEPTP